jgi:hypothetical protein
VLLALGAIPLVTLEAVKMARHALRAGTPAQPTRQP